MDGQADIGKQTTAQNLLANERRRKKQKHNKIINLKRLGLFCVLINF